MKLKDLFLFIAIGSTGIQAQWINGFFVGNNGVQLPSQIPWTKYTTIIHFAAYAGVNGSNVGNGTVNMSNVPDTAALIASKAAGKKVLLCLKDNDSFLSAFGQSAAAGTRATFVTNITSAVVSNGYDGVDLDWEANLNQSDYVALIAALRAAMPTKLITIDVYPGLPTATAASAQANLDQVNVECYDLGNFSASSWYNDAVFAPTIGFGLSCYDQMFQSGTNNGAVAAGVARAKIGVGMPFYGYRWTGCTVAQASPCTRGSAFPYRTLVADPTRWQPANQRYDNTYKAQSLSVASLNEFDPYTGTQQIADIVAWAKSQSFGGYFTFVTDYEYRSGEVGDDRYPLSTALFNNVFNSTTPFPVDNKGWVVTGLAAGPNSLLGPLTLSGTSPWIFGDLAEKGIADNMAPAALAQAPALGTRLAGTVAWTQGDQFATTTTNLTSALAGQSWVAFTWDSIDGPGTGRALCPISSVTASQINCQESLLEPSSSGVAAYLLPPPVVLNGTPVSFEQWTTENPNVTWNYYDVSIALYRLYYRTGNAIYLNYAQQYADIMWQWTLDHGYRSVAPRASAMLSQFFRVAEGHTERLPGLYNWIVTIENPRWVSPASSPAIDNREVGYQLWNNVIGAKIDTDPTRHTAYCSAVSANTAIWNSVQAADGSFPENEFALNQFYVSAPKTFTAPFIFQGAPWREAINVKALEAAYESLNDTSGQGCNDTGLAASTLTTITNAVTWQNNYGRDTVNRGIFYEVNSQSDDQDSTSPATGTVSISLGSNTVTGVGTNFLSTFPANPFIGFYNSLTIYKRTACVDNTHCTLADNLGLYGEGSNVSASQYGVSPPSFTGCASSATYCFGPTGDRNLTRTTCGGFAWLYSVTLNLTYKGWSDECVSASLGGPTAGLTTTANIGNVTLPCSGTGCDGLVTDTAAAAANCSTQAPPCAYGTYLYGNFGKNYGETYGAPGIDNALAWRNVPTGGTTLGGKISFGGTITQ